jgi:aquaporin Z
MSATQESPRSAPSPANIIDRIDDFNDPRQEWRRLFSELLGTFLLVMVAAGGGMMDQAFPGVIGRSASVRRIGGFRFRR